MGVTSKPGRSRSQSPDSGTGGQSRVAVAEMEAGEIGVIKDVGDAIRNQVTGMGVRPGQRLEFHTRQPFDGPVVVSVGNSMTSLSREYARKVTVAVE